MVFVSPSLKFGGMERVMSIFANHLAVQRDFIVEIVLFGINPEVFYPLDSRINIIKTPISAKQNRLLFTLRTVFWLRKSVSRDYKTYVVSFGEYWNSFILISLLGIKNVSVTISDRMDPLKILKFPHELLRKTFYRFANNIIFQSNYAKNILEKRVKLGKTFIIPNPINNEVIGDKFISRENEVLFVGRIIETKNVPLLINSFKASNNKDWRLVLVGDNDLKQNNNQWLKGLKQESNITHVPKTIKVNEFYSKAKIFAFPSISEGFPNVVLEALFNGLKVLVMNLPVYSDVTFSKFNNLYISTSELDFKNKLNSLMNDDSATYDVGWDITDYNERILKNFQGIF